jgi:excisionase family DNA binding protein
MSTISNRNPTLPMLLTVGEVAECLVLSTKTVYRRINDGTLPHHRVGRAVRIALEDLRSHMAACRKSETEIS